MPGTPSEKWYWCLHHERVEPADGCSNADRLGPYPSQEAAADWRATLERRNAEWDREDAENE